MALVATSTPSSRPLPDAALPLRFERLSMSSLCSVVSDCSPGSALAIVGVELSLAEAASTLTLERVRGRFGGGLVESADFLCLWLDVGIGTAESPASSPEASREDGWSRSAVEDFLIAVGRVVVRLRLVEPADEGDDMATKEQEDARFQLEMVTTSNLRSE